MPGGGSALLYCHGLGSFGGWLPADRNCKREFLFFEFGDVGDRHDIYGSKSIPRLISLPVTFFVSQVRRSWRSDQLEWDGFGHSSTSQDWNLNGLENGWIANLMNAFPGTDSYRIPWLQFFCRDLWVNFPKLNWASGGTTSKKKVTNTAYPVQALKTFLAFRPWTWATLTKTWARTVWRFWPTGWLTKTAESNGSKHNEQRGGVALTITRTRNPYPSHHHQPAEHEDVYKHSGCVPGEAPLSNSTATTRKTGKRRKSHPQDVDCRLSQGD